MGWIIQNDKVIVSPKSESSYSVCKAETGGEVGSIGLVRYGDWSLDGIVFSTEPEFRRNGFAAAAVRSFTRWYYDTYPADMLVAVVELENVPAIRTLERAGYEYIRSMRLQRDEGGEPELFHLYTCSREAADAGAPAKGCCCGCGGHAE